jgi:anthranilate/para-aminobenzoate synthase component I
VRFLRQVQAALAYIRAGDVYQVNIAHRLTSSFEGSPRSLFLSLMRSARPWYGAYLEFKDADGRDRVIASASPELFLDFDPASRRLITRPMKGTRRGDADPSELLASAKDHAELTMITDLMRNDLGRICEFGSVRVESARDLERHGAPSSPREGGGGGAAVPGGGRGGGGSCLATSSTPPSLLQTTSTIRGTVRPNLSPADILAATFPGGSITGAPKIRAMQIIDELEPVARGPYCGCIGFLGDDSRLSLSIAIRTALLTRATGPTALRRASAGLPQISACTLDYSVGAGIVADSDPDSEWAETLAKAAVLERLSPSSPIGGGAAVLRGGGGSISTTCTAPRSSACHGSDSDPDHRA